MKPHLFVVTAAVALVACDNVDDHYNTLQDARADELFQRGWLPDILPPSSHDIQTSNDLDINVSSGEFHFKPEEFPGFAMKVRPYSRRESRLYGLEADINRLMRQGYVPYEYVSDGSVWVFLCRTDRGVCEYRMW